jgi:hypothetical protein
MAEKKKRDWKKTLEKIKKGAKEGYSMFALYLLDNEYKKGKIKKKEKREIEDKFSSIFKKNYWNLNPNLRNPMISEIFNSRFNTFYI